MHSPSHQLPPTIELTTNYLIKPCKNTKMKPTFLVFMQIEIRGIVKTSFNKMWKPTQNLLTNYLNTYSISNLFRKAPIEANDKIL